jgi:CRISPR-associated protein Cas2
MRGEMLMVFVYDISANKTRRKVAALLEDNASRVQKSVFEARMSRRRADALAQAAARHLDQGDSLRVYAISRNGLPRSRTYGTCAPIEPDGGYWLV